MTTRKTIETALKVSAVTAFAAMMTGCAGLTVRTPDGSINSSGRVSGKIPGIGTILAGGDRGPEFRGSGAASGYNVRSQRPPGMSASRKFKVDVTPENTGALVHMGNLVVTETARSNMVGEWGYAITNITGTVWAGRPLTALEVKQAKNCSGPVAAHNPVCESLIDMPPSTASAGNMRFDLACDLRPKVVQFENGFGQKTSYLAYKCGPVKNSWNKYSVKPQSGLDAIMSNDPWAYDQKTNTFEQTSEMAPSTYAEDILHPRKTIQVAGLK